MPRVSPQNFPAFANKVNVPEKKGFTYWIRSVTSTVSLPNITSICLKAFDYLQKIVEHSLYPIKSLKNWFFTKFFKEGKVDSSAHTSFVTEEELQRVRRNLNSTNPEVSPETPNAEPPKEIPKPLPEIPSIPPSEQPSTPIPEQPPTPDSKTPEWLAIKIESPGNITPPRLRTGKFPMSDSLTNLYLGRANTMRRICKPIGDEIENSPQIQVQLPVLTEEQTNTENQENDLSVNTSNLPRPIPIYLEDIRKPRQLRETPKIEKASYETGPCFNLGMIQQLSTPPASSSPFSDSWS